MCVRGVKVYSLKFSSRRSFSSSLCAGGAVVDGAHYKTLFIILTVRVRRVSRLSVLMLCIQRLCDAHTHQRAKSVCLWIQVACSQLYKFQVYIERYMRAHVSFQQRSLEFCLYVYNAQFPLFWSTIAAAIICEREREIEANYYVCIYSI